MTTSDLTAHLETVAISLEQHHLDEYAGYVREAGRRLAAMSEETLLASVSEAIAGALGDAMDCTRVWSAWSHGTMSEGDFVLVADDAERVHEIATAVIAALQSAKAEPAKPSECKDGCPPRQVCDYCQGTGGKDAEKPEAQAVATNYMGHLDNDDLISEVIARGLLTPKPRALSDDQLRALAAERGFMLCRWEALPLVEAAQGQIIGRHDEGLYTQLLFWSQDGLLKLHGLTPPAQEKV